MKLPYRWLLFDIDGTLFSYTRAEAFAIEETFRNFAVPFQPAYLETYQAVNGQIWQQLEQGTITPDALKVRRFEQLFDHLALSLDAAAFSERYLENLGRAAFLLPEALSTVRALHAHYPMALVTNGLSKVQRARLAGSEIEPFFSHAFISEEVGAAKPDQAYFTFVFQQLGNPNPAEVLIIGDSLTSDMRGGQDFGIATCWFNPAGQPLTDGLAPTYQIAHLSALLPILIP